MAVYQRLKALWGKGATQRLSVSMVTRNSEHKLAQVVSHARTYADEIVIGVDADSSDRTWEVACTLADCVYRFRHPGQLAAAHMHAPQHCSGDWILRLDDDEFMESDFSELLPELLNNREVTHYLLPRKWVISEDPPRYLHASPWFPNHAVRLFRNDRTIIWKPPRYHSGYWIAGPAAIENRAAILHYEPVWCDPERRIQKVKTYREGGGNGIAEEFYEKWSGEQRAFKPPIIPSLKTPKNQRIHPEIRQLEAPALPPWGCRFDHLDIPAQAYPGQTLPVIFDVTNTGAMTWWPAQVRWPVLSVSYRITVEGKVLDGARISITRVVRPGESVLLSGTIEAPTEPGDYLLVWDMVSEWECWFAQCGSTVVETCLRVIAPLD